MSGSPVVAGPPVSAITTAESVRMSGSSVVAGPPVSGIAMAEVVRMSGNLVVAGPPVSAITMAELVRMSGKMVLTGPPVSGIATAESVRMSGNLVVAGPPVSTSTESSGEPVVAGGIGGFPCARSCRDSSVKLTGRNFEFAGIAAAITLQENLLQTFICDKDFRNKNV
jgi:hypothetical protein